MADQGTAPRITVADAAAIDLGPWTDKPDDLGPDMRALHATPTGMAEYPGLPLRPELVRPALWVAEIVYFPLETELMRRGKCPSGRSHSRASGPPAARTQRRPCRSFR